MLFSQHLSPLLVNKAANYVSALLVLLFPVLSVLVQPSASILLGVIVLMSIFAFTLSEVRPSKHDRLIAIIFAVNVIAALLIFFIKGYNEQGWSELGRIGRFLLLWPVMSFFICFRPSSKIFWFSVCIASFGAGLVAGYQVLWLGSYRASATMNAILFGNISLVYTALSGLSAAFFYYHKRPLLVLIALLASLAGMFAVVASGTRGAWITVPFVTFILLYYSWGRLSFNAKLLCLVVPIILLVSAFYTPQLKLEGRINSVVGELVADGKKANIYSVGQRFEMWKVSIDAWLDSPVIGQGQGGYVSYMEDGVEKGRYSKRIAIHSHSHNDYFFILASRGLVGLTLFLAIYIMLLNRARKVPKSNSSDQELFAIGLIVVVVCFAIFGLTEAILIRSQTISVFVILVGFLLAMLNNEQAQA